MPAIATDIDGVVYRGSAPVGNSPQALRDLMATYSNYERQTFSLPFVLLTNGGGILEKERAKVVNKIAGIDLIQGE